MFLNVSFEEKPEREGRNNVHKGVSNAIGKICEDLLITPIHTSKIFYLDLQDMKHITMMCGRFMRMRKEANMIMNMHKSH